MIKVVKTFFLDLIFPKFCVDCQKEGSFLCSKCEKRVLLVKTQICPGCGRISKGGKYCLKDRKPHGLAGIIVAAYYEEGPIKEAIHNLKYNALLELAPFLGSLMATALKENIDISKDILITAVPLHFLRKSQRGFNQSELLGTAVAENLKLQKNFNILRKIRYTKPQVKFSGKKRRKNLINCYKIFQKNAIFGRTIILIDDVTTTGTTLNECAKVLRAAGAKRVWGLVVAKG